jgi:hypothetical protein
MTALYWTLGILGGLGFIYLLYKVGVLVVLGEILEGVCEILGDIDLDL